MKVAASKRWADPMEPKKRGLWTHHFVQVHEFKLNSEVAGLLKHCTARFVL